MTWAVTETFEVSWEDYRRIAEEIGERDLPDGLYFHVAGPEGDGVRTMSVWESQDACDAFDEQRAAPAAARVLGEDKATGPTSRAAIDARHFLMAHAITPASHQVAFY